MLIFSYYFSMPTKKKAPAVIKGPQFNGSTPLNHDDVDALSVDGFGSPAETLLDNINWSREIVALTGIRLTPDNLRVASSAIFFVIFLLENMMKLATKCVFLYHNLQSNRDLILEIEVCSSICSTLRWSRGHRRECAF